MTTEQKQQLVSDGWKMTVDLPDLVNFFKDDFEIRYDVKDAEKPFSIHKFLESGFQIKISDCETLDLALEIYEIQLDMIKTQAKKSKPSIFKRIIKLFKGE